MKKKRQNTPALVPKLSDPRVGDVVLSTAGHDKGSLLMVVGGIDEGYVLVSDGKQRKLAAPKKKNVLHLEVQAKLAANDLETLRAGKANDAFLRKKLKALS